MSQSHHPGDPTCRRVFELLSEYVDGELSREERESLAVHLQACPPCEEFLRTFQAARELCRQSLMEKMPEEMKSRLRAFVRDRLRQD